MADIKNFLRGTGYPQVTDDSNSGFVQGSYYQFNGFVWFCRNAAVGAAEWAFIGDEEAIPSGNTIHPANSNGSFGVSASPGNTFDLIGYFPFKITRPVTQAGLYLSTLGSAGAQAALGLYTHDRTTMKQGTRIASFGTINLDGSTGFKTAGSVSIDRPAGLYWVSVALKLNGITTTPTFVRMTGSNGKHIHRSDGAELLAGTGLQMYSSHDTYTSSPPGTPGATSAINEIIAMPVLKAS